MEVWKTSNEFKEIEVSNLGQVRYTKNKELLKIRVYRNAAYVSFRINGYQSGRRIKIMIARVFLSELEKNHVVCIDGNIMNCAANNLEYRLTREPYRLKAKNKLIRDDKWIEGILQLEKKNMAKIGM